MEHPANTRTRIYALMSALGIAGLERKRDMFGTGGVARPIRFGIVGLVTFAVQAGIYNGLVAAGGSAVVANAAALALAVQFNFVANQLLVWADQPVALFSQAFVQRWATFHGAIALSVAINYSVFLVALLFVPGFVAVVIGIGSSTAVKFVSLDRYAFRSA